ncbi:MAG: SusC/RagA family TonB-linked outer membrane protein [Tannerella sp.]|jgi:TonB-linked SusC/RagA family outer membrane protein|nr:SusC/RagA family TonB-linked outer membrane protein [Tannerella sp.]
MMSFKQSRKKIASALLLLLFAGITAAGSMDMQAAGLKTAAAADAQQDGKTVTGTVTDNRGEPLPGVSVVLTGTTQGSITDADGRFSIRVTGSNRSLRFSYVGYKTVTLGTENADIRLVMEEDALLMDEVVVTAMGIKKEKKALGYAVQELGSEELLKNKTANPINALSGKIAGVNVTQSSGSAGSGAQIVLRGGTSLERDNQPVFVVDGVIYDNTTSVNGNSNFDGLGGVATTNSNRVMDINPEDIESMSVLKGPAAAALYGSRAAAGVIIITTKKGQEGTVEINVASKVTSSWVNRLPEQQSRYKRGAVDGNLVPNPLTMSSWGEPFGASEQVYDNVGSLFSGSLVLDNNISLSGGNKDGSFYLSASHYDQEGVIPSTGYDKTTFRFNSDRKYGKLTVGANVAYSQANTDKTLTSAGLWGSGGTGVMNAAFLWPRDADMTRYLNDDGSKYRIVAHPDISSDTENPYWIINKNKMTDFTERLTGNINLDLNLTDWLNIGYRLGLDTYTAENSTLIYPGGAIKTAWQNGMMSENEQTFRYLSSNLMAGVNKTFGDFDLGLLLGTSTEDTKNVTNRRMGYNFVAGDFFSFNTVADTENKTFMQSHSLKRMVSAYGEARAAYKNFLYLTFTERNDNTSTLPVDNRSYWYHSVSGSFVFSELLPKSAFFTFGKIRASQARVGKDADPYVTNTRLNPYLEYVGGLVGVDNLSYPRGNPYLKPEMTEAIELGLEMHFLDGRIGFDYTYYNNNSYNQLLQPRLSQTTGYIMSYVNAGDMYNRGMELSVTGQPLKTKNLTWESTLNLAGNRGTVKNLIKGVDILYVTDVQVGNAKAASFNKDELHHGYFMGISGSKWNRTDDGKVILDAYGMPTSDGSTTYEIGNREPKLTGGFNNTLRYRDWDFSFLLDFRLGGHVYNGTDYFMTVNGMSKRSESRESLHIAGVVNTGTADNPVYEDRSFTFNAGESYVTGLKQDNTPVYQSGRYIIQEYWNNYYAKESANFMTETNWLRLRAVSLSYNMPAKLLAKTKVFKGCLLTLSGNNLLLLTNYRGMDPETSAAGSGVTGSSSVGIDYCGVPSTAGMSFGINLKF